MSPHEKVFCSQTANRQEHKDDKDGNHSDVDVMVQSGGEDGAE